MNGVNMNLSSWGTRALVFLFCFTNCMEASPAQKILHTESISIDSGHIMIEEESLVDTPAFSTAYLMGKFDPASHPDFAIIDPIYASRKGMLLRKDAYTAFLKMYNAAKADGVSLKIISATRNFTNQKSIWERKWTGVTTLSNGKNAAKAYADPQERALKILLYSSMPGTSRHHWGTDIDINAFNNGYFKHGRGATEYAWLVNNAATYGFYQPYTLFDEDRKSGYQEERWHWSYFPVASKLVQLAKNSLTDEMIQGFQGSDTAVGIEVVKNYVLGIAPTPK